MNIASSLLSLTEETLGLKLPIRLRAWDGSEAGVPGAPVVVIRSKRALRHIIWKPGELGVARAYVQGDLDVEGDLGDGLRAMWDAVRNARVADGSAGRPSIGPRQVAKAVALAVRLGAIGRRPPAPAAESNLTGELHSKERDQAAISHHYDLSNDFYELILDPNMAYSSGFHVTPEMTLEEAQTAKLHLICKKLDLQPGMRMVDIGSGWGSLTLFAAEHYGVHVTGVTLSVEQRDYVMGKAAERGLADRVDVSLRHFRDLEASGVRDGQIDAIASIEMGEHVGDAEYVVFVDSIFRYLKPGGRALIQQMSRSNDAPGDSPGGGPFIETYIAPDMHMKPLAKTIGLIAASGLEIRDVQAMREHYPQTVAGWAQQLEDNWDVAVKLIGEENARVWRLYLVGGALAFEENRMGVDQILSVKPSPRGVSGMPTSPLAWLTGDAVGGADA
ncbi:SAM-dependent methyltransferase [Aeromicrobium fastidiosum]|uniref:Class I SAM-dependent methyltransferase n=1 Tax=Aeromicrobium fastidiosum TaxID=52699 RepID=A0A641AP35_9ACTN|nr:cyclopropane-fatty-acyl-phospholipid synthase family protein [Aeromicrobium fastidiosum]KAA1379699.1 class I SAM-dependent methyltransferase [Aeromicrobium fastidiosum]MBP2389181.1 cyclopropane-fatty-acyl-phospholipid synthase [Aeromicrobium fastidiosum]